MIIITLVLFANIFVQWIYFKDGTPPDWVQKFSQFCGRRKVKKTQRVHVASEESQAMPTALKSTTIMAGIEMRESNRGTPTLDQPGHNLDEHLYTWHRVSTKMDRGFFILFIIISVIAYAVYIGVSL